MSTSSRVFSCLHRQVRPRAGPGAGVGLPLLPRAQDRGGITHTRGPCVAGLGRVPPGRGWSGSRRATGPVVGPRTVSPARLRGAALPRRSPLAPQFRTAPRRSGALTTDPLVLPGLAVLLGIAARMV